MLVATFPSEVPFLRQFRAPETSGLFMEVSEDVISHQTFLTKAEAAQFLRVSVRTVDNWMRRRLIAYYRVGGTVRFRRSDLEQNTGTYMARRSRQPEFGLLMTSAPLIRKK